MDEKDEAFFLKLAQLERAKRRLAKIQNGRSPASEERVRDLESEIERLDFEIDHELEGGPDI